ncbi:MAG TPA: chemotaxis protein CheW [Fibrobacteria bacterium]|nr:chemotaxis protein CheW [Fibrobacteria bacterium]
MDEFSKEFIAEAKEGMDMLDQDLLVLEKETANPEIISGIFRVVHSIKGGCGFMGFEKLESLAHAGENLLSHMRDGTLLPAKEVISCLFKLSDAIRAIILSIESGHSEGDADLEPLIRELSSFKPDWVGQAQPGVSAEAVPSPEAAPPPGAASPPEAVPAPETAVKPMETREGGAGQKDSASSEQTIRVDVALLDKLMNLVGELVLVRNQVLRHAHLSGNTHLTVSSQHLNLITTELQEGVMKTRMQPIRNVWSRFPRIVRELSNSCGKMVQVEMVGEDTELDKTILEAIKDPLIHVLRNSIDHGIESPGLRESLGKPREGRVLLRAFHLGGKVVIEISDDGAGIDCGRVAIKALEKGLVKPEKLASMQDWELAQLIFLPGFSTAEKITTVSGRGVGMDVVKTHIEKIGGTLDLLNRPGMGLTLRIKIPLTLAIIPALIVETSNQRFAIPQINVLEVVKLRTADRDQGVEWFQETPVYRLRGKLLPLARLDGFSQPQDAEGEAAASPSQDNFVVVLQAENHHFGIPVHSVQDTQEIVVKPLSKHLKSSLFSGASIMGDGKVALIMDVPGLAQNARLTRDMAADGASDREDADQGLPKESLLIVECDSHGLMAIPIASVSRLQELSSGSIEQLANMDVFQSRGKILPLVRLDGLLRAGRRDAAVPPTREKSAMKVVVFREGTRSAGFVVDRILDIVDASADIHLPSGGPGFKGSMILKGKATEVLDLAALARTALPSVFSDGTNPKADA